MRLYGIRRVQINATAVNEVDTSNLAESAQNVLSIVDTHVHLEFIIQKNGETNPLWEGIVRLDGNVSMLADNFYDFYLGSTSHHW